MTTADLIARLEAATGKRRAILDRLDRTGDCWLWTGALDEDGRGRVWLDGKLMLHHRAVWEILVGPLPEGALLCHHCDNRTCGNPAHEYVGDSKTNARDMSVRRRTWAHRNPEKARASGARLGRSNTWCRGEANAKAKLTADQARAIAESADATRFLAAQYGVNRTTIQRIRRGAAWH